MNENVEREKELENEVSHLAQNPIVEFNEEFEPYDPVKKIKSEIISWVKMLAVVFITVFLVQRFVFISVRVQGMSMYPTLYNDQRLILWSLGYQPDAFDIIVLEHESGEKFVKRIIGMPGDTINYREGSMFINGELIDEPYVHEAISFGSFDLPDICQFEVCDTIPVGYYLVMGDNRNHSEDSRHFGLVSEDVIYGVVTWRYWPLSEFGRVRN